MIHKMSMGLAFIVMFTASALAQGHDSRIGDDYARAALRAIIYTTQSGISAERISILVDEADVEASTPAEEASLKEINRILAIWISHPIADHQACYVALKMNLKARNGTTPEACK